MKEKRQLPTGFECCPPFDPEKWQEKTFEWKEKKFIKDQVFTLFYMPLNFGRVMRRLDKKVRQADLAMPDYLCLSDHTSKWNMDVLLAVDKEVPNANNTTLSGKFISKVYEGDFKETDSWSKDFENYVKGMNQEIRKWYMWYTTCPRCAKKYGKNYVAILGEVNSSN
jgi:hypothetical protein